MCDPPNLHNLICRVFFSVPLTLAGLKAMLSSLLSLESESCMIDIPVLVQLLNAAPALQSIRLQHAGVSPSNNTFALGTVNVDLSSSTCEDHQRVCAQMHVLGSPVFKTDCEIEKRAIHHQAYGDSNSAGPCMHACTHA